MNNTTTYEIHTLKDGRWMITAVHNTREKAITEAREMTSNKFYDGIKVVAEIYEENSGNTFARTLFTHDPTNKKPDRQPRQAARSWSNDDDDDGEVVIPVVVKKPKSLMSTVWIAILVMLSLVSGLIAMSMFVE
ncbi:MAG: hypothetical protein ISR52_02640 [Rhodospirillales bacterium]|nr:hypothetical protein [Rhodospirillales bacterium]